MSYDKQSMDGFIYSIYHTNPLLIRRMERVKSRHLLLVLTVHQAAIWHWAVARLLLVLWEHDHEIIRHAHGLTTDDEVCDEV